MFSFFTYYFIILVFFSLCAYFFTKYKHPIPLFNKYSRGTCTYTRSMILIMILKKYSWIRHTWFRRMRFSWYKHSVPTVFLSLKCILFRYIRFRHIRLSAIFLGPWLFSYIISSAYTIFYPSCHQRKRLLHLGLKYWICSGLGKKTWIKHLRSIENAQPIIRSSSYTISFCCSVEKSHMLDSTVL